MPRPKTISDAEVIEAALATLAEKGPAFTITDIADRVKLSRATLIQRFGDRQAILLRMADFQVEQTRLWLDGLPSESGPAALRDFPDLERRQPAAPVDLPRQGLHVGLPVRNPPPQLAELRVGQKPAGLQVLVQGGRRVGAHRAVTGVTSRGLPSSCTTRRGGR